MSGRPDPVSDAMWADLHAAQEAGGPFVATGDVVALSASELVGMAGRVEFVEALLASSLGLRAVFAGSVRVVCACPACQARAHAAAGCDGCSDLGYPCADHAQGL